MIDVDLFIDAIRERPALYNPTHEHYTRKEVRMSMWNEIGLIVHPEWATMDERFRKAKTLLMQKKWKSLKDCFNRELRLRKAHDPSRYRKPYEFFEKLMFLFVTKDREPSKPDIHLEPFQEIVVKTEPMEEPEIDQKTIQKKGRPKKNMTEDVLQDARQDLQFSINSTTREIPQLFPASLQEQGRARGGRRVVKAFQDAGNDQRPFVNSTTQEALREERRNRKKKATEVPEDTGRDQLPFLDSIMEEAFQKQEEGAEEEVENHTDRMFLLSFVKDMERLPMTTRYWVKMKFSEIMHEAAMSIEEVRDDSEDDEELDEEEEFPDCTYYSG